MATNRKLERSFEKQLYRGPKILDAVNKRASETYIKDAQKHWTAMRETYKQLAQPHSRNERVALIENLNHSADQYVETVDHMSEFHEEIAAKIAELRAHHDENEPHVVPRAKEHRNVLTSQIGRGNIGKALAKLQSAVELHSGPREKIATFRDEGGFKDLLAKQKAMAGKYDHLDNAIPQSHERMSFAEFAIAHGESSVHHADLQTHYKDMAGLVHNFGVAAGFEEEKKKKAQQ